MSICAGPRAFSTSLYTISSPCYIFWTAWAIFTIFSSKLSAKCFFPSSPSVHLCQSSALLQKSLHHFLSVLYLLNRLSDYYHFFIKIYPKYFFPDSPSVHLCRSSILLYKSLHHFLSVLYLLNRLSDFYNFLIKLNIPSLVAKVSMCASPRPFSISLYTISSPWYIFWTA